jgi:hypothetical protein
MDFMPVPPRLERFGQVWVTLAPPLMVGPSLVAERRIIPITGGRFEGDMLRGDILPGGADWQTIAPDGTTLLEARYTLHTDDGAYVSIHNRGIRHGAPDVLAALSRGEPTDPATYYFRTTPIFAADEQRYAWLNRLIVVCSGVRTRDTVMLDFYAVR